MIAIVVCSCCVTALKYLYLLLVDLQLGCEEAWQRKQL
jgi:hypothetical protein